MNNKKSHSVRCKAALLLQIPLLLCLLLYVPSCSSVFTGGANGRVMDAESAETPKTGISGADVYVYVDQGARDNDFNSWNAKGKFGRFSPSEGAGYVGHASTANDGTFTISKLIWQSYWPKYGKTADYCNVYLLFYHDNFGLTKNSAPAVIISDGSGAFISQELIPVRNTTSLQISIRNAAADAPLNEAMSIKITVPQPDGAVSLIYEQSVTGTAAIPVSYPKKDAAGNPFTPEISISAFQGGDEPNWKMCHYNAAANDYRFMDDSSGYPSIQKAVNGKVQPVNVYVKAVTLRMPSINGRVAFDTGSPVSTDRGTETDDRVTIELAYKTTSNNYVIFPGNNSKQFTNFQTIGQMPSTIIHGNFNDLGSGIIWRNDTYPGLYDTKEVGVIIDKYVNTMPDKRIYTFNIQSNVPNVSTPVLVIANTSKYNTP